MKPPETGELKKFGLGLTVILGLIGGFLLWRGKIGAPYLLGAAGLSLLLTLLRPAGLTPVFHFLMWLAPKLAWLNTQVILILVFFLIFTPVGLVTRLIGKDLLRQKIDRRKKSYWVPRKDPPFDPESYDRQF